MTQEKLAFATVSVALVLMSGPVEARGLPLLALGPTDFFSLAPCRVIDTRNPTGPRGGPALVAGADRAFPLANVCGIPSGATAVSVTIAVTGATAAGNLRLHEGGTAVPLVSAVNYSAGQTRSNNAVVPLSPTAELAAFVGAAAGTVHFILDVNGYFAPTGALPALVSLLPESATVAPNGTLSLTVGLDLPAPAGGTSVTVALAPANAGTVPATVTVPQGQVSAQFNYVDGGVSATATVTATLGATMLSSVITIAAPTGGLMINEVDYDQPGNDMMEFVELYNPTAAAIPLANLALILVNGGAVPPAEYSRVLLGPAGAIAAGGYLVIGTPPSPSRARACSTRHQSPSGRRQTPCRTAPPTACCWSTPRR